MPIVCLGLNHQSAPLSVRERLAFTAEEQHELYSRLDLAGIQGDTGLAELGVLSTCNRTELYGGGALRIDRRSSVNGAFEKMLARDRRVPLESIRTYLYRYEGTDAVRHLCRVATGLDSMVIGESEILGQVQQAHRSAIEGGAAGPVLHELFSTAVRAGRRARAETGISRTPVSVASEAIRVAREVIGGLSGKHVLIVGTGKMGRVAGRTLRAKGVRGLSVVSRTRQNAEELARECGATPLAWHELATAVADADVIFCSTGAPHSVITLELVQSALERRSDRRPMLFLDIAVPRDVEETVSTVEGVRVIDIDHLRARLNGNLAKRRKEIPRVERIIEEELARFEEWTQEAELRPLLSAMWGRGEQIRRQEVERALDQLGAVSPEVVEQLQRLSRALVKRMLHQPSRRLREESDPERAALFRLVTRQLYGLSGDGEEINETP